MRDAIEPLKGPPEQPDERQCEKRQERPAGQHGQPAAKLSIQVHTFPIS
jgi:hypothetical protein